MPILTLIPCTLEGGAAGTARCTLRLDLGGGVVVEALAVTNSTQVAQQLRPVSIELPDSQAYTINYYQPATAFEPIGQYSDSMRAGYHRHEFVGYGVRKKMDVVDPSSPAAGQWVLEQGLMLALGVAGVLITAAMVRRSLAAGWRVEN